MRVGEGVPVGAADVDEGPIPKSDRARIHKDLSAVVEEVVRPN